MITAKMREGCRYDGPFEDCLEQIADRLSQTPTYHILNQMGHILNNIQREYPPEVFKAYYNTWCAVFDVYKK